MVERVQMGGLDAGVFDTPDLEVEFGADLLQI
jgi:hypothetical protein